MCELVDDIILSYPKSLENNSAWLNIVHELMNEIVARARFGDIMKSNQNERRNHDPNRKHQGIHQEIHISTE
jgi:hypothetical protein